MSALVVPTQEEECGGVVDLERPEVENALRGETARAKMWGKSETCADNYIQIYSVFPTHWLPSPRSPSAARGEIVELLCGRC